MKKIFILTGEPSGDKLASTVISKLKVRNPNIEYLSVGGNHLKKLGISSIFNLKDLEKNKIQELLKSAEEQTSKNEMNDQTKYLIDQKIDVLRSIN